MSATEHLKGLNSRIRGYSFNSALTVTRQHHVLCLPVQSGATRLLAAPPLSFPYPLGCPRSLSSRLTRPYLSLTLLFSSARCRPLPSLFLTQLNLSSIVVWPFFFAQQSDRDRESRLTERISNESRSTNDEHKGRTKQKNRYCTHQRIISTTVLRKATIPFYFLFLVHTLCGMVLVQQQQTADVTLFLLIDFSTLLSTAINNAG